jgi:hypothetical protein
MLNTTELQTILFFLLRDAAARRNFLIACLVTLANFVVPILPSLLLTGYIAQIVRPMLDEKRDPTMPEWNDWNAFINDGLRIWGFQIVLSLPLILIMFFIMGGFMLILAIGVSGSNSDSFSPIFTAGMFMFPIALAFFMAVSIPIAIFSPVGAIHVIAKRSFSSGFAYREWWPIFMKTSEGLSFILLLPGQSIT